MQLLALAAETLTTINCCYVNIRPHLRVYKNLSLLFSDTTKRKIPICV